ncbi:hypothetical protein E2C01_020163 [Portunus trituberculatus]|uniref:Uncharacterized protein n=1 Tax=Portunus trituberculatus TaxID=210409 RepID=A0A5B7DZ86_PORTR|nr:hypothetical protein [Portunus trituberculatus]
MAVEDGACGSKRSALLPRSGACVCACVVGFLRDTTQTSVDTEASVAPRKSNPSPDPPPSPTLPPADGLTLTTNSSLPGEAQRPWE